MVNRRETELISLHGGHSGEFCCHARGTLEEMILSYSKRGFTRVGITEHIPPESNRWLYPDEVAAGFDAPGLYRRFAGFVTAGRDLQKRYADRIAVYLGFETEAWSGYGPAVRALVKTFRPDYLVGSVHHVEGIPFDHTPGDYQAAADRAGGVENLYCRYYDLQLEMIERLRPGVVAHLDLIRVHDPGWSARLGNPEIADRVRRNLRRIAELSLILDCNCRLLPEGGETYPARKILRWARNLGVSVVPGDDSHSPAQAGRGIREGIALLKDLGFSTDWTLPTMPENWRSG